MRFLLRFCVFVDVVFLYKVCFGVEKTLMQIWKAKVVLGKIGNVCFLLRFCVFLMLFFCIKSVLG